MINVFRIFFTFWIHDQIKYLDINFLMAIHSNVFNQIRSSFSKWLVMPQCSMEWLRSFLVQVVRFLITLTFRCGNRNLQILSELFGNHGKKCKDIIKRKVNRDKHLLNQCSYLNLIKELLILPLTLCHVALSFDFINHNQFKKWILKNINLNNKLTKLYHDKW